MARLLGLDSMLEFHPAMTSEDLMKAGPGIEQAVKTYVLYILRPDQAQREPTASHHCSFPGSNHALLPLPLRYANHCCTPSG
jgi:hypothetical protein